MPPTLALPAEVCPEVVLTDRTAKTNMHRRYAGHSNIRSSKLLIPSSESLIGRCVVESVSIVPDVVDLLPIFRTKLSMISAKERGSGYVEEQSHRGADDRSAEATGGGAQGGGRSA